MTKTDTNIPELVINTLTNAEYEAAKQAGEISSTELYMTTDDPDYITEDQLAAKQDTLVSGTNIKTINNQSILGSGNIEIGSASEITNQNPTGVNPLRIWQGTEQEYNQGEITEWKNWKTDDVLSDTENTLSNSNNWRYIIKGADKYILISSAESNTAKISNDAINWEDLTLPASADYRGVCYGNGVYLLFPVSGGTGYYYSTDGINWELKPSIVSHYILGVSFLNNKFFAYIGNARIAESDDGLNWSIYNLASPYGNGIVDLAYGNGIYVGVPDGGRNYVEVSTDGINWTTYTGIAAVTGPRISFGNGVFVITYGYGTNSTSSFSYSTDGINWTKDNFAVSGSWNKAYFCNGEFIVYGGTSSSASSTYFISSNGSSWTQKSFQNSRNRGDAVCVDNNLIIAPSRSSTSITYLSISNLTAYTLDEVPTTSSVVYSAPSTQSALTVTAVDTTNNTITLSDNNIYNRNSAEDTETYRSIGEIHPDYICNINNVGVKIGNALIADNTTLDTVPTQGSTNAITSGAVYEVLGNLETALYNFNSRTE